IRTFKAPAAKGVNRAVWDLRYAPPVDSTNVPVAGGRGGGGGGGRGGGRGGPPAAVAIGFPGGADAEGGGGGRGNVPVGPLVLPGRYAVRIAVPGATPLTGTVTVE